MIQQLNITAIVENTAGGFEVAGEWGLALWVEADEHRILSDTGRGRTLMPNANLLGIDPASAELLVISHGHHDHTGGIAALMDGGFQGKVYMHPAALASKFQRQAAPPHRPISIPANCERALRSRPDRMVDSSRPTEIASGMMLTGAIPRRNGFEDILDPFFLDRNCTKPDPVVDDQALLIETVQGWVVITGCGHAGIINTLDYAAELTGSPQFYAVVGGLHLFRASAERLKVTADKLEKFGVQIIAPCHCSGFEATGALLNRFGSRVVALRAGLTLSLL